MRMPSAVSVKGILSADRVTADSQAGKASGPVVEDRCVAALEPAAAEKSAVAAELPVAADSAVAVDSMAEADSMAAALAAAGDKMKNSEKYIVTIEGFWTSQNDITLYFPLNVRGMKGGYSDKRERQS